MTFGSRRWLALAGLLVLLPGCADRYLIPDGYLRLVNHLSDEDKAHVAIPAVRDGQSGSTWVRADRVELADDGIAAPAGWKRATEVPNRGRVSAAGVASMVVGALLLGGTGFIAAGTECSASSSLPCTAGAADLSVGLSITGGFLFSLGSALQLARGVEHHPAEPGAGSGDIVFVGAPYLGSSAPRRQTAPPTERSAPPPARTPMESGSDDTRTPME